MSLFYWILGLLRQCGNFSVYYCIGKNKSMELNEFLIILIIFYFFMTSHPQNYKICRSKKKFHVGINEFKTNTENTYPVNDMAWS
jgi:hypothetical protein